MAAECTLLLPHHEDGHHFLPPPRPGDNKILNRTMAGRLNNAIMKRGSIEFASLQWPSSEKATSTSESHDIVSFAEPEPSPLQITGTKLPDGQAPPVIEETPYPKGSKLALITLALCLAVFLFALVRPPLHIVRLPNTNTTARTTP